MSRQLQETLIWGAMILSFLPIGSISAQEEPKADKKSQAIDIQIEVTDGENGNPIDNVKVLVKWGEKPADSEQAVTDRKGIANVKNVPAGAVTIRLIAKGYKTVAPTVDLKTKKPPIKITLEKAALVSPPNHSQ
jgi:hypothetical protein